MKQYFALRLNPPRPTFAYDMTDEERSIMQAHVGYWTNLMNKGDVVVFGPVMDPQGPYGLGVISADSQQAVEDFIKNDPANGLNSYEYHPMRAVLPQK